MPVRPQRRLLVNTSHAGLALLPRFFVSAQLADGSLCAILPDLNLPVFDIFAVWPENAGAKSLASLFINFLVSELDRNPPLARHAPVAEA